MWFCICMPVFTSDILINPVQGDLDTMSFVGPNSEDDTLLFNEVQDEISCNVRRMMEALWINWSHLGIDHNTKCERIRNLILIEKDLHRDVIQETEQKLKALTAEVNKLKDEAIKLGQYLSMDISIQEFADETMLFDYKKNLENQISGYRHQVEQRKTTIQRLRDWQSDLCQALGVEERKIPEIPLPSEEELGALSRHLDLLQQERDNRMAIFLNAQKEIKEIMETLSLRPVVRFESLVVNSLSVDFKVTDRNMEKLTELLQSIREQLHTTQNRVVELRERLNRMWEMLEEDSLYRTNFLKAHPGCGPQTEKALREEIQRCEGIKKQKIQVIVSKIRTEIKQMWDACMFGEKQRSEFLHYRQDIFSEDALTLHEMYLDDLKKIYDENRNIYDLVATRQELWEKKIELHALASDPRRYQNRGGQLLQEEKQRKQIDNKLPKIEAQLRSLIVEYETANGKQFTVNDRPLVQLIEDDWAGWETKIMAERQTKASARKQALTPITPSYRSMAVSPGKRNRTAAGLPGERTRSAKRPLLTASASKLVNSVPRNTVKRQAVTTAKKRTSGRIAVTASTATPSGVETKEKGRRKLNYNELNPPRITVNGSILKHKRRSRRSSRRWTRSRTESSMSTEEDLHTAEPVAESTLLTSYTDFKEHINDNTSSRSSLAVNKMATKLTVNPPPTLFEVTPKKTPIAQAFTPKHGKENILEGQGFRTPITRSIKKDVFATPRAPLSATKTNVQKLLTPGVKTPNGVALMRQNTQIATRTNTPTALTRSKSNHVLTPRNVRI